MSTVFRRIRRRVLTPNVSETELGTRGFHEKSPEARELIETVGRMFLTGYAHAVESRSVPEVEARLETLPTFFRGFAYEGAAMGCAMLDALPLGGGRHVERLLAGRGGEHVYMAYIGVGWAMARVPRFRWARLIPPDPLLSWLVLDGYGFHQAYFHTRRYVHEQFREPRLPWPVGAPLPYADNVVDQGIGRALWFVGGTDAARVADLIDAFPADRRSDLYSGAGLAATYLGGADEDELRVFADRSGEYRPQVAQGSAFAAEARVRAGLVVEHTGLATRMFCAADPEGAAAVSRTARPEQPVSGALPAFEVWRRRIADEFVSLGRS
ncbi:MULTISPECIES: DUF1702 family protein [Actinoalloteichus]|uniref:DUF1702 family protein n=1 Tax=Actinoalloteichus fjordicus TaxID=1612552 RepID=A0AAC9LF66_9PSEU|nr:MULTISPECIES: DUF1702 family protein [Actinoalloteichus]APU15750.1 putative DUF1702 family protein [Actinoalloteichus fjordicus]APU21810.1 putative DUF1702 family protein [Actinoalloteichus sp. GBA129-24]